MRDIWAIWQAKASLAPTNGMFFCTKATLRIINGGEASSWDYVQKIKNNLEHIFTKFRQFMSQRF